MIDNIRLQLKCQLL